MSSENWILAKDLCRCCHSEGTFKNLAKPCKTSVATEIYVDMLKDCFDIDLTPVPGMLCAVTYTICELCVTRLRDASDFKKQVQSCEVRFRDMYDRNVIRAAGPELVVDVKQEIQESYQEDDFKEEFSNEEIDNEYEDIIEFTPPKKDHKTDKEEGKRKKKKLKTKKTDKSKRSVEKTVKQETEEQSEPQKKKGRTAAPKFRLNDEDYIQDGNTFKCARCDKKYDKIFSLRFHVKTKHYKIPRFSCNICLKEFMTPAPLTVHKLEMHNVDERYKCKACKGMFNTKVQLRKHINNFHMLGERLKCEFCDYESFSFEDYATETASYYTLEEQEDGSKNYTCTNCGRIYKSLASVVQHYRHVHLKLRPKLRSCYLCDVRVPGHVRAFHLEKEHGIPAPTCGACGKKFAYPSQVLRHQKNDHMGEKKFNCEHCDMKFSSQANLTQHMIKHSSIRVHKCEICAKAFKWKKNLRIHVKIHLGDKRHVCPLCQEAFVQQTSLKYHLTTKHPEYVY